MVASQKTAISTSLIVRRRRKKMSAKESDRRFALIFLPTAPSMGSLGSHFPRSLH